MFTIPALSDWSGVHVTMFIYIVQGIAIAIMNIPLILVLLCRKKNRDRKEFILIACVSIIDIFYVVVNAWNSFVRLTTIPENITRAECNTHPMYFISLVASQLVANMPLMVAFDRLIATMNGVWYYKQSYWYSLTLCAIPVAFSFVITLINLLINLNTSAGTDKIINYCFTSGLPAPSYKYTYHSIKWICIILAGIVYLGVAYVIKTRTTTVTNIQAKRIWTANLVMGLSTVNSILFHLIPDFLLVAPFVNLTIFGQCIFFSLILEKIMFNFFIFMVFHKELRSIYGSIFFRGKKEPRSTNSSGAVATASTRMFSQGNSGFLSKIASRIRSRFSQ